MDVEPEVLLEDGEIEDDEAVEYVPLERPINNIQIQNCQKYLEKISDNDSEYSSDSEKDSDSDEHINRAKKPKAKVKVKKYDKPPVKRKKYDIWSSHVQEDVLAETLISCDVSRIDRSRNVESYNAFDLRRKIPRRQGNKRRHNSRYNKDDISLDRRSNESDEDDFKGSRRVILDLATGVDNTDEEIARDMANKLCEEKDDLMLRIVQIAGKKKSIEIFNETKKVELDGGMPIMNRTRRRTPGGVFIFLLKRDNDVSEEQQKLIFSEDRRIQTIDKKARQKAKLKAIKEQIAAKKTSNNVKLPSLLSRADLTMKQLNENNRERNESESEEFVNNPPPSPVTDGKENSNDGMSEEVTTPPIQSGRSLHSYEDDAFLDINVSADMDLF